MKATIERALTDLIIVMEAEALYAVDKKMQLKGFPKNYNSDIKQAIRLLVSEDYSWIKSRVKYLLQKKGDKSK